MVKPRRPAVSPFEQHRLEEERRKHRDQVEASAMYDDFVRSFEADNDDDADAPNKAASKGAPASNSAAAVSFVRGGKVFSAADDSDDDEEAAELAKVEAKKKRKIFLPPASSQPQKRLAMDSTASRLPGANGEDDSLVNEKRASKKRNIEELTQSLKREQEEREQFGGLEATRIAPGKKGSFDTGDPVTTNIFVGNLNPTTNEDALHRHFAPFGPIGSVKVMWPRSDEEYARGHNSGFVSFMQRGDAEIAFETLRRQSLDSNELRLAWGKPVAKPAEPLPEPAGVSYGGSARKRFNEDEPMRRIDPSLPTLHVHLPLDMSVRRKLSLLAVLVVKHGYALEKVVAEREKAAQQNGDRVHFSFLVDDAERATPESVYYRWRVYTLLQGDQDLRWRTAPFAVYEGGGKIQPPTCGRPLNNPRWDGAPGAGRDDDHTSTRNDERGGLVDVSLKAHDREKLSNILSELSWERDSIADAMVFCVARAASVGAVVSAIAESLTSADVSMTRKIARLFLVSDILHNSASAPVKNVWTFRSRFESVMDDIFRALGDAWRRIDGRLTANVFYRHVDRVLTAWEHWSLYAPEALSRYRQLLLGKPLTTTAKMAAERPGAEHELEAGGDADESIDGEPLPDGEDIDGEPLAEGDEDDIDGEPM